MEIISGLFSHMVLQRNQHNCSEAPITGLTSGQGAVCATVKQAGKVIRGMAKRPIGRAAKGRFQATLKGLPTGGPYAIELRCGDDTVSIRDVLVGDVWLLGGQSNMQGCGHVSPEYHFKPDAQVRAFYMNDRWDVAKDPVHNLWEAVDQVHCDIRGGTPSPRPAPYFGVCPGPAFGQAMKRLTGVPQGLIACAHGGTNMKQWDPKLKKLGSRSLYGALLRRLRKNGGQAAGLVWYQGCSDANQDNAHLYTKRMKNFMAALRRDLQAPRLPAAVVQIARVVGWPAENAVFWNSIQEQQRRLPETIRHLSVVPAIDLALDDGIHLGGAAQLRLGQRLAYAMQNLRLGRQAGLPQITLKKTRRIWMRGASAVVAEFANVVGHLRSGSRPSGFTLVTPPYGIQNHFDITLDGRRAIIRSNLGDTLDEASLHYGYGTDPYCNITDEADRSLPVLGPIRLGFCANTPYITTYQVSAFQPGAGRLKDLQYPRSGAGLGLKIRKFSANFCDMHLEIARLGAVDSLVYYVCPFHCSEPMRLEMRLGYDGPVKTWIDGKEIFYDPKGVNPAWPGKGRATFKAAKGKHKLWVALGTNNGAACGIFLKLSRLDVARRLLLRGPSAYAMPQLLV